MEITKREILVAVIIIIVFIIFGIMIHGQIKQKIDDQNAIYNKALKIDDESEFRYGMSTNVGNAFIFGTLKAVDTVSYPEIDGEYMRLEKSTEVYTQHTRIVTYTDSKGNTQSRTEVYYTWDLVNREIIHSQVVNFLNVDFDYGKFNVQTEHYIDTVYRSLVKRDVFRGTDTVYIGTIFTDLRDNTISDKSQFLEGKTIDEANEQLQKKGFWLIGFWILWIALLSGIIYGFFYLDNGYLNN